MKLHGKVALVTGGGQGIGESIVLALARQGADIIINDIESNIDNANRVAGEVANLGQEAVAVAADVAQGDEVAKMLCRGLQKFNKIDILVNNAGISRPAVLNKMTDAQWDEVLNVNLKGVFNCCRAVIPKMIENKWGRIVTISSLGAKSGTIGLSAYNASKAGCIGLTKSLAKELARHQILVNAVLPGYIETSIQKAPKKYREAVINECPLKRAGKPEEVAAVVAFLASHDASYITGAAIEVGGGLWL